MKKAELSKIFEIFLKTILPFDWYRPGLKDTPLRMEKAWNFWLSGYDQDPTKIFTAFEDGAEGYNSPMIVGPIDFYSHCEHHLAPFFGQVWIYYHPKRKILGLSKFARLVEIFARRLQVQERLTTQIGSTISKNLPHQGVAVVIRARHLCMESRGIQKPGVETKTIYTCPDVPMSRSIENFIDKY